MNHKERRIFNEEGYLLLKDFFKKEDVLLILKDAKEIFLKQFIEKGYVSICTLDDLEEKHFNELMFRLFDEDILCFSNCGKQAQHLISLHQLSLTNKIVELLSQAGLETPTISTRPVLYFNHSKLAKKKVYHTVDAHQDWRSMQGSLNSVVLWIPLINIDKDLGALQILAKSHLGGLRTERVENSFGMVTLNDLEKRQLVSIEVDVGDALLFSSFLIHQSGDNITNKPRWRCHFRYNDLSDPTFIERKYAHPYVYKPTDKLITADFPSAIQINNIFRND